jgi:hypothetical protein
VVQDQGLFLVVVEAALEIGEDGIIHDSEEGMGWIIWLEGVVGRQERRAKVFIEMEKSGGVTGLVPDRNGAGVDPGECYNSSLDVDSAGRVAERAGKGDEERGNG